MSLIDFEDDEYGVDEAGASSSDQDIYLRARELKIALLAI